MAIDSNGKIVIAGVSNNTVPDFATVRLNSDGTFDTAFGGTGLVTTDVSQGGQWDQANALTLSSDGDIIVAGQANNGSGTNFALVRYSSTGTQQPGFGYQGMVTTNFGSSAWGYGVAIQSTSTIAVVGYSQPSTNSDFALAQYSYADGSLDPNFGSSGTLLSQPNGSDTAEAVVYDGNGYLLVAGQIAGNFGLARYDPQGNLDPLVGGGSGWVSPSFGGAGGIAYAMALQSDGKIVLAGWSNSKFTVARFNTDGSLDATFGNGGIVASALGSDALANSVAVQNDGKIVAAGFRYANGGYDFAVVRYNVDGSLDSTFGNNGVVTTDFAQGHDEAFGIAIQNDGKIVVVGYSNTELAVARYLP